MSVNLWTFFELSAVLLSSVYFSSFGLRSSITFALTQ
jgi:hypothetical protein